MAYMDERREMKEVRRKKRRKGEREEGWDGERRRGRKKEGSKKGSKIESWSHSKNGPIPRMVPVWPGNETVYVYNNQPYSQS